MNINSYQKFISNIKFYQFMYVFLIILITFLTIIELFKFKNLVEINYQGIINNNYLEISNLTYDEVNSIIELEKVKIDNKEFKNEIVDILEINNTYLLKIKLNKVYLNNTSFEITYVLKEESLYQFILKTMKGDL